MWLFTLYDNFRHFNNVKDVSQHIICHWQEAIGLSTWGPQGISVPKKSKQSVEIELQPIIRQPLLMVLYDKEIVYKKIYVVFLIFPWFIDKFFSQLFNHPSGGLNPVKCFYDCHFYIILIIKETDNHCAKLICYGRVH